MKYDGFMEVGNTPTASIENKHVKQPVGEVQDEYAQLKAVERYLTEQLAEISYKLARFK